MRPPSYYTSLANRHTYTPSHTYTQTHSNYGDSPSSSSSYTSTLSSSALRSSFSSPSSSAYAKRTHLPYVAQSTLVAHAFTGPRSYGGSTTSSSYSSSSYSSSPSSAYYTPSSSSSYSSRPSSLKRSPHHSSSSSSAAAAAASNAFRSKNPYLSSGLSLPRTSYLSSTSARSTYTPAASRPSIAHYYQPVKLRERPLLTQISRQINRTPSPAPLAPAPRHREPSADRQKGPAERCADAPPREQVREPEAAEPQRPAGATLKPPPSPFSNGGAERQQDSERDWSSDVSRLISRNKFIIKFREFDKPHQQRASIVESSSSSSSINDIRAKTPTAEPITEATDDGEEPPPASAAEQISDKQSSTPTDGASSPGAGRVDGRREAFGGEPQLQPQPEPQSDQTTPGKRPPKSQVDKAHADEKVVDEKPAKEKRDNAKPRAVRMVKVRRAKEAEARAPVAASTENIEPQREGAVNAIDKSVRAVEKVVESERCQVVAVKDKIQPMQVSASTDQTQTRLSEQQETIRNALKHRRASADKKLKLRTAEGTSSATNAAACADSPEPIGGGSPSTTADSQNNKQKAKRADVVTKKSKGSADKLFSLVPALKAAPEADEPPAVSDKRAEPEVPAPVSAAATNRRRPSDAPAKQRQETEETPAAAGAAAEKYRAVDRAQVREEAQVREKDKDNVKENENERPEPAAPATNERSDGTTKKETKKKKVKVKVSLGAGASKATKQKTKAPKEKEAATPPTPPTPTATSAELNQVDRRRLSAVDTNSTPAAASGRPARQLNRRIKFREYNLDDFDFLSVLGHGGWGFVILAELKEHDACFAVKCIKKITIVEDDDFDSIMIERKMLALGNVNPFICKLFCTFETEGYLFFVMEYCPGGDLMFHVQHEGKFTEPRCRFYAAEIISAIRFLHNRHIIYRDLKLDNILLDATGHIRLVDFGMCQCRTYREEMLPSNFCGTPEYISPEIIKGVPYNHSVDWWSFGVLLYEMAVGKMPFRGNDENELLWNVCYEQIHYPMFLSRELTSLLQALLEREPAKRMGMATCKAGDICDQAWFRGVDWAAVESLRVEPPFVPQVTSNRDVRNFDTDFTESACELSPVDEQTLARIDQSLFKQFPYTNPNISIFDQT